MGNNRIKKYFEEAKTSKDKSSFPLDSKELVEKAREILKEELDFGIFNFEDHDDSPKDSSHNKELSSPEAIYMKDKLDIAHDKDSVLSTAKVIFRKDPRSDKVYMLACLDEMDLPDEFSANGDEMFKSDILFRIFGKAFCEPKQKAPEIDPSLFKKKNWEDRR